MRAGCRQGYRKLLTKVSGETKLLVITETRLIRPLLGGRGEVQFNDLRRPRQHLPPDHEVSLFVAQIFPGLADGGSRIFGRVTGLIGAQLHSAAKNLDGIAHFALQGTNDVSAVRALLVVTFQFRNIDDDFIQPGFAIYMSSPA